MIDNRRMCQSEFIRKFNEDNRPEFKDIETYNPY